MPGLQAGLGVFTEGVRQKPSHWLNVSNEPMETHRKKPSEDRTDYWFLGSYFILLHVDKGMFLYLRKKWKRSDSVVLERTFGRIISIVKDLSKLSGVIIISTLVERGRISKTVNDFHFNEKNKDWRKWNFFYLPFRIHLGDGGVLFQRHTSRCSNLLIIKLCNLWMAYLLKWLEQI